MYAQGRGTKADMKAAAEWLEKAAAQGEPKAQTLVGRLYLQGGVKQDVARARDWFSKAAEQDEAVAQLYIGQIYEKGIGVKPDPAEALKWLSSAAKQGVAEAQFELSVIYSRGRGVTQDNAEALKWLTAAAKQKFPPRAVLPGLQLQQGQRTAAGRRQGLYLVSRCGRKRPCQRPTHCRWLLSARQRHRARSRRGVQMVPESRQERRRRGRK